MRIVHVVLAVMAVGSAGCLESFADGGAVSANDCSSERAPPADEASRPRNLSEEPAPRWAVGQSWSYAVEDGDGRTLGRAMYRVVGFSVIGDEPTYCVIEHLVGDDWRAAAPPRLVHYAVADLNVVWDACGEPHVMSDCRGRVALLDFPLWEGKEWVSRHGGGDVVDDRVVTSTYDPDAARPPVAGPAVGAWRISAERQADVEPPAKTVLLYSAELGLVVERVESYDGAVFDRWVLAEHSGDS